jgi:hypothetical protein
MLNLRLRLSIALIVLTSVGAACAVALASPGKGEVGGPPSIELGSPDEGTRTSAALVFAVGSAFDRPVELVAYAYKSPADSPEAVFCVWAEKPSQEIEYGTCAAALSETESPIVFDMQTQQLRPKPERSTVLGGRITPEVAAVRLYFRRPGTQKRVTVDALIGQVDGDLQRRLKQPAPFGFFYAEVRGLVRFRAFKAVALDSSGEVIGTARG